MQGGLDGDRQAFARAHPVQARGDHACVVEQQQIARPQKLRQIAHVTILRGLTRFDHQQPRAVARLSRTQGDAVLRQFKIEVG